MGLESPESADPGGTPRHPPGETTGEPAANGAHHPRDGENARPAAPAADTTDAAPDDDAAARPASGSATPDSTPGGDAATPGTPDAPGTRDAPAAPAAGTPDGMLARHVISQSAWTTDENDTLDGLGLGLGAGPAGPAWPAGPGSAAPPAADAPLIGDAAALRTSWQRLQESFVDDPRAAVSDAAALVEHTAQVLVGALRVRQRQLRGEWAGVGPRTGREGADNAAADSEGADTPQPAADGITPDSTERLRRLMQRYRSLFNQICGS